MRLRILTFLAMALVVALVATGCGCGNGSICNSTVGPSAPPAATPAPTASPAPGTVLDPCRVESIVVSFKGGVQRAFIEVGKDEQIDATPFNSSGQVSDGCNLTRQPIWEVADPAACVRVGTGYNPYIRGLKAGTVCRVSATMYWENRPVSGVFWVDVR